ncbi:hypothetical protein, partial [Intestinimonas timonensis]|uniref:hypothetical protein n=1 Tax=Intestinimonas timonensis TaxID=1689270 RepID=UPI0010321216
MPEKSLEQQRKDLITERAAINSHKVYTPEKTAENRARLREIDRELSTLTPSKTSTNRLKSGAQSILSTGAAAMPVIGDTFSQLNKNTRERAESGALDQLTQVNQQIRALEAGRTGDALTYIRSQDQWKALDQKRQALNQKLHDTMSTAVSPDSAGMQLMRRAGEYREQALEGLEGVPRFLGGTALSIGQNAALLPLAAVNPALPLVAMGTISAADRMYELGERGMPASEALSRGLISGGIEAATEKIPLDTLLDAMKTGGKGVLRNILRQAGTEAGEESVSYLANYLVDKAYKDPEAEFSLAELAQAAAGGALSGGVFGTFGTAYNTLDQRSATMDTIRANQANPDFNTRSVESAKAAANQSFSDRFGAYPETLPTAGTATVQETAASLPTPDTALEISPLSGSVTARDAILGSLEGGRRTAGDLSAAAEKAGNLTEASEALSALMEDGTVAMDAGRMAETPPIFVPRQTQGPVDLPIAERRAQTPPLADEDGETTSVGAAPMGFDEWSHFQNQSGQFFPEGANAARPVDVPTTDPSGRKIRKTASTAMGARAIPDEVVGEIQRMVLSGQLSYDRVT